MTKQNTNNTTEMQNKLEYIFKKSLSKNITKQKRET